jgi:predicted polyphosphate/ATP-dependent NAD kinase
LVNIARHMNPTASVIVVADGDGSVADTLRVVSSRVNEPVITIVPDPTIEASWLSMTPDQFDRVNSGTVDRS